MKIHEIKKEDKNFRPIRIQINFESLDEIKSLIAYLNTPEEIVKKYYYDLNSSLLNKDTYGFIKIEEIERVSSSTLIFLNNIVLSSERLNE